MGIRVSKRILRRIKGQPAQPRVDRAALRDSALECDIQQAIVDWLTAQRFPHAVTDASRVWGKDGGVRKSKVNPDWPDISGVIPAHWNSALAGRALFIETKAAWGRLSPGQALLHAQLRAAGAVVLVPYSVDEFLAQMENLKNENR